MPSSLDGAANVFETVDRAPGRDAGARALDELLFDARVLRDGERARAGTQLSPSAASGPTGTFSNS